MVVINGQPSVLSPVLPALSPPAGADVSFHAAAGRVHDGRSQPRGLQPETHSISLHFRCFCTRHSLQCPHNGACGDRRRCRGGGLAALDSLAGCGGRLPSPPGMGAGENR